MAKPKKPEKEPNHERWLVSYADFITLLFAVFVVLYAMSQTDKKKVDQVVASMRESFGMSKLATGPTMNVIESQDFRPIPSIRPEIQAPGMKGDIGRKKVRGIAEERDMKEIKANIENFLKKQGADEKIKLDLTKRGLVISLKEAGFFDPGSAIVKQSSYPLLAKIAESLQNYANPLRIEGHTDQSGSVGYTEYKSNWELSSTRAINIVHYLVDYFKYDPRLLSATGYAEHRPVDSNDTSEGRAHNRRVDIVMLTGDGAKWEPGVVPEAQLFSQKGTALELTKPLTPTK